MVPAKSGEAKLAPLDYVASVGAMQWYYEQERQQRGPVDESELKSLYESGEITSSNLVWCKDMQDWATYGSTFSPSPAAPVREAPLVEGTGGRASNADLRAQARQALSGSWGMAALAVFLWQTVLGAAGMVPLLGPLAQLAIGGAMMVGLYGFFSRLHRSGVADIGELFQGFSQFLPAMGIYLLTALLVFLASALAAVPGIAWLVHLGNAATVPVEEHPLFLYALFSIIVPVFVVSTVMMLRYGLIYFIAGDQPGLGVRRTLQESVRLMRGRKWKLFFLCLSFLGWHVLGALAFVIGLFWSSAYMFAGFAAFYEDLKEN